MQNKLAKLKSRHPVNRIYITLWYDSGCAKKIYSYIICIYYLNILYLYIQNHKHPSANNYDYYLIITIVCCCYLSASSYTIGTGPFLHTVGQGTEEGHRGLALGALRVTGQRQHGEQPTASHRQHESSTYVSTKKYYTVFLKCVCMCVYRRYLCLLLLCWLLLFRNFFFCFSTHYMYPSLSQ